MNTTNIIAATKIQSLTRGHLARKNIERLNIAARLVQKQVKRNLINSNFFEQYKINTALLLNDKKFFNYIDSYLIRKITSFLDITNQVRFKNTCKSFYRMKFFVTPSDPQLFISKLNISRVRIKMINTLKNKPEIQDFSSIVALSDPNICQVDGFSHRDILTILSRDKFTFITALPNTAKEAFRNTEAVCLPRSCTIM